MNTQIFPLPNRADLEISVPSREASQSIGALLVDAGHLAPENVQRILDYQKKAGLLFGEAGVAMGLLDEEDVQRALALQFGQTFLAPDSGLGSELIAATDPNCAAVEHLRALRSQLMLRWFENDARQAALAVVSPGSGEGRSYITANLAVLFSQLGKRTLLIDADLRRPRQHHIFGLPGRIGLSSVLAGHHSPADILINPLSWYAARDVTLHAGLRVAEIDLGARSVRAADGSVAEYDTLVMATGSQPIVPRMDGLVAEGGGFRDGVFVFRTLDDCDRIMRFAASARTAAVIGGGLLGLEAARGLLNWGLDTHVVHLMPHLMDVQIDAAAGAVLRRRVEELGLHAHLDKRTSGILGNGHVSGLEFVDGSTLNCDLVVIAAGIRPNVRLAVWSVIVVTYCAGWRSLVRSGPTWISTLSLGFTPRSRL